jgi:hypothetical protein
MYTLWPRHLRGQWQPGRYPGVLPQSLPSIWPQSWNDSRVRNITKVWLGLSAGIYVYGFVELVNLEFFFEFQQSP